MSDWEKFCVRCGGEQGYNPERLGFCEVCWNDRLPVPRKLLARVRELTEALTWIADPSYVGNYDDAQVIEIHRSWAKNALAAGETEE